MSKLTQLDKVLAGIDQEIATLQAARLRIVQQQAKAPKRKATKKLSAQDVPDSTPPDASGRNLGFRN